MFARPLRGRNWSSVRFVFPNNVRFMFPNKLRRFDMMSSANVSGAILGMTLTFVISSGVAFAKKETQVRAIRGTPPPLAPSIPTRLTMQP
jgi:hypothetical protein